VCWLLKKQCSTRDTDNSENVTGNETMLMRAIIGTFMKIGLLLERTQQMTKKLSTFLGFSGCRQAHKCAVFSQSQDYEAIWGLQLKA